VGSLSIFLHNIVVGMKKHIPSLNSLFPVGQPTKPLIGYLRKKNLLCVCVRVRVCVREGEKATTVCCCWSVTLWVVRLVCVCVHSRFFFSLSQLLLLLLLLMSLLLLSYSSFTPFDPWEGCHLEMSCTHDKQTNKRKSFPNFATDRIRTRLNATRTHLGPKAFQKIAENWKRRQNLK